MSARSEELIEMLYDKLSHYEWWLHKYRHNSVRAEAMARSIGTNIYDLPCLWTGYMSRNAIEQSLAANKLIYSNEHFRSRQMSGYAVLEFFASRVDDPPTLEEFRLELTKHQQVHRTTSTENTALTKYQKAQLHWVEAYDLVGIQLAKIDMTDRKTLTIAHLKKSKPQYVSLLDIEL